MCPSAPMPHSRMHDVNGCRKMHPTTKRDVLHFIPIHIRFYPLLGGFCSSQLHLTIHALRGKPSQTKLADPTGGATRSPPPPVSTASGNDMERSFCTDELLYYPQNTLLRHATPRRFFAYVLSHTRDDSYSVVETSS